jgi:hypothetical protein
MSKKPTIQGAYTSRHARRRLDFAGCAHTFPSGHSPADSSQKRCASPEAVVEARSSGEIAMISQEESMHKQHMQAHAEHARWLEKLQGWRIEHHRSLAQLTILKAELMEHDAEIEEHLSHIQRHERLIEQEKMVHAEGKSNGDSTVDAGVFGDRDELDHIHRLLRADLQKLEKVHTETMDALHGVCEQVKKIRADFAERRTATRSLDNSERIHEAGVESFPASDPPSFNPGIA